ncbi:MAG: hypothetical protein JST93_17225 [Acidobacteria bacterium]|nr:hypothetical protein [Acidobacteriota bacterium]
MEPIIKEAQKLLKEALAVRPTNPRKAKKLVAEAVRVLMQAFPKTSVGPDFPETTDPSGGTKA